jgi:hypothetical protein
VQTSVGDRYTVRYYCYAGLDQPCVTFLFDLLSVAIFTVEFSAVFIHQIYNVFRRVYFPVCLNTTRQSERQRSGCGLGVWPTINTPVTVSDQREIRC